MIESPARPVPAVNPHGMTPATRGAIAPSTTDLKPVVGSYHVREVVEQLITPNDFPRLISLVRSLAPDAGVARQLGDGLQWEHTSDYGSGSLTINPEPTGTVIRADLRTNGERVAYFLAAAGAALVAAGVAGTAHLGLGSIAGISFGTLALGGGIAQLIWRHSSRRQAAQLEHVVATIAAGLRGELD